MQDFKNIKAWQRAHALSIALHELARRFAAAGHAGFRAQLTRAADSIATNIVEGCGSSTQKEFARYLDIAIKSANETEHHLLVAHDLHLVAQADWQRHTAETVAIRKMIYTYRMKILQTIPTPP
ncbi:MAG: four helix bundle protein [Gemmatimonadales bacterium]|jgi:four helix bundle protein